MLLITLHTSSFNNLMQGKRSPLIENIDDMNVRPQKVIITESLLVLKTEDVDGHINEDPFGHRIENSEDSANQKAIIERHVQILTTGCITNIEMNLL